jgi:hypothetical protein
MCEKSLFWVPETSAIRAFRDQTVSKKFLSPRRLNDKEPSLPYYDSHLEIKPLQINLPHSKKA